MDAVTQVPTPVNEPVHGYAPGSPERARLEAKLKELADNPIDLPMTIGGEKRMGGGEALRGRPAAQPQGRARHLRATPPSRTPRTPSTRPWPPRPAWRALSFDDRAAIILRAAELLSGPWRETLAASTMLGQSKTAQQAEIDTPCELDRLLALQRRTSPARCWPSSPRRTPRACGTASTTARSRASSTRSRPSTSPPSRATCPTAPALMGNVVVWKPSPTQTHAAVLLMQLLEEAGLPKGVINLVTGDGIDVSEVALNHPRPRGHPLHRLDQDLPVPVEDGRQQHREVPHLPAPRRRDRRQGLRRRPPVRRPRRS